MEENVTLTEERAQEPAPSPDIASVIGAPETFGAFQASRAAPEFREMPTSREAQRNVLRQVLGADLGGPVSDIQQRQAAATEKVARGQLDQKIAEARGVLNAQEAYAKGVRGAYAAAEPKLMAPPPTFNVTKDTEEGLMGLATIMPLAGLIIGGKGQMAGINAMNAMAGALQGYQTGNKERIAFETKKYEEAWKQWQAQINQVKDSLARYMELAKTDLATATSKAKLDAIAMGAPIIADLIEQQTLTKTFEMVEKIAVSTAQANAKVTKSTKLVPVQTPEGPRLVTEEQAAESARTGQPMTPAPRAADRGLYPSALERKNYVGLNQLVKTADELIAKLDDPEFAKKVDKYRLDAFLSEEGGKVVSQILRQKIPEDVQDFINKATNLRNKYYLEISGKAVTGGEAMRNYNVVPQPGMNAQRLAQTLRSLRDGAKGDVEQFQTMYPRLPELTRGGTVIPTLPDQPAQAPATQRVYEVGEIITSGGKRYRTISRGTDPDVEEIQ